MIYFINICIPLFLCTHLLQNNRCTVICKDCLNDWLLYNFVTYNWSYTLLICGLASHILVQRHLDNSVFKLSNQTNNSEETDISSPLRLWKYLLKLWKSSFTDFDMNAKRLTLLCFDIIQEPINYDCHWMQILKIRLILQISRR